MSVATQSASSSPASAELPGQRFAIIALRNDYPRVADLRLTDYRVRVLDSEDGTSASVRVLIETSDHESSWGTIGVHENVIEASWEALADGIVVGLLRAT